MKLTFDPRHNIAYLRLAETTAQVETVHISDELNVDLTPDGKVYGIELLNANEQLRGMGTGRLLLENESTGETLDVALPWARAIARPTPGTIDVPSYFSSAGQGAASEGGAGEVTGEVMDIRSAVYRLIDDLPKPE
jgi:uncharacterized protein YuzE